MKGLVPLFLGLFGTFAFSWFGLTVIPNWQIGHLDPQMDEEGTDIYPMPVSGMADRGRHIYTTNGCFYCHSQQMRPDYISSDIDRKRDLEPHPKWGERRSAPRDYIFARPVDLGKMRMGPDVANMGKAAPAEDQNAPPAGASPAASPKGAASPAGSPAAAASPAPANQPARSTSSPAATPSPGSSPTAAKPTQSPAGSHGASPAPAQSASPAATSASPAASPSPVGALDSASATGDPPAYSEAWHHKHLYAPRSVSLDSNMPAYRFLYEKRRIRGEHSADALRLSGRNAPKEGWEIVPTYDAKCLVAYLMSLDQSHPLKEVNSGAPAAATSPSGATAASPAPATAASPAGSPPPK